MAIDAEVRRYREWYAKLLRLYPQPFQERFGEGMEQTFQDLCRERRRANSGLFWFALGIALETSLGVLREGVTDMSELKKTIMRAALIALGLLMVPLVASRIVVGWNWDVGAFLFAYLMFFGTVLAYALIARKMGAWAYKVAVGLALVAGFVMGWGTMVRMSESENPVNLVYIGVLVVGGVGAFLARLEARGMARALFAMAAALAVLGLIAAFLPPDIPHLAGNMVNHLVFVALFGTAGLLFRQASLAGQK